jgi:hypothetical protein
VDRQPDLVPKWLPVRAKWVRRAAMIRRPDEILHLAHAAASREWWADALELQPGWVEIADELRRRGTTEEVPIRMRLTGNLVSNVVHAETGVSYTMERIGGLWTSAQAWVDENVSPCDLSSQVVLEGWGDPPQVRGPVTAGAVPPERDDLSYECVNLFGWCRAMRDRMDRRWRGTSLGLLPALNPHQPISGVVRELHDTLKRDALTPDFARLANLMLHATVIPYPWGAYNVLPDGRLSFRLPDEVPASEAAADGGPLPTYAPGRDFMSYSRALVTLVAAFTEGLLAAFEDPTLNRLAASGFGFIREERDD